MTCTTLPFSQPSRRRRLHSPWVLQMTRHKGFPSTRCGRLRAFCQSLSRGQSARTADRTNRLSPNNGPIPRARPQPVCRAGLTRCREISFRSTLREGYLLRSVFFLLVPFLLDFLLLSLFSSNPPGALVPAGFRSEPRRPTHSKPSPLHRRSAC